MNMVNEASVARVLPRSRTKPLSAKDLLSVDPSGVAIASDWTTSVVLLLSS